MEQAAVEVATSADSSISILSFLAFLALSVIGAYMHYRKVCKTGRHFGSLWDYLVADHPTRSMSVGIALLGSSWLAATSGVADQINPELVWSLIMQGKFHIPSVAVSYLAFQSGWQFDSQLNKGGNE